MTTLKTAQLEQYNRDGIVFPVKVLSPAEADSYRRALEALTANCGQGALKRLECLHLFFDWAHRLATHSCLLDAVEDVLGGDILIDGTLVFHKPPKDSSYVSWHQDSVYSGWNMTPSTSAWLALTPSERRNGCMRAIPGSHKLGMVAHGTVSDERNMLDRGEQVETVDESQAVDVVLQPGEMSFHQSNLVHGSNPNTSDAPRIGFIVRFVTSQIRDRERPLLRVRGEGDCSHLKLAQPPGELDQGAALSAWRTFSRL